MSEASGLDRAQTELAAARHLIDGGFYAQATSRAYYAAFYVAEAALLSLGETRSKHSGVIAAFIRLVVGEGGADEQAGRLLRWLFDRRGLADYSTEDVLRDSGERAVTNAEQVVAAVERWLTGGRQRAEDSDVHSPDEPA